MITGYNNDIKHRGTVFHVQTEDKGVTSAWIESLIYTGGRILARKRVTYKQLLDEGADKPAIAKLMERQHRLMIRQIRDGRFDSETSEGVTPGAQVPAADESDIHTARIQQQAAAMFAPSEETPPEPPVESAAPVTGEAAMAEAAEAAESAEPVAEPTAPPPPPAPAAPAAEAPAAEPATEGAPAAVPPGSRPTAERPPTAAVQAALEKAAAAAGEKATDAGPAPTLDQVIFDYLSSVAREESLVLLMDESPALASNTTTRMDLGTHASRSGKPIANAQIAVRMISKTGGPVTLAEGTTSEDGTLQLVVDVPKVPANSAALIITAASSIGNAEIKHLL